MIIEVKLPIKILALAAMLSLFSCGDEPPPVTQPKVVNKKIAIQPAQAKKDPAVKSDAGSQAQPADKTGVQKQNGKSTSDLVQASLEVASTYDPKGRFDPFEPLFKEQPDAPVAVNTKSKRKRRIPQTPLERVALSQLKLSAVIRAPSGNRALVEDATGKGYVVFNGTYIGLNSGKVIQIENDRIVIEEEIENILGALTIQNTELKLQKPAGEL